MSLEIRANELVIRGKGRRLEGYAAVFNTPTMLGDGSRETIAPGAFAESLGKREVLALLDHDQTRLLARTRSNTLRIQEDSAGLQFDLDLPDTSFGRDVQALAQRGDLGGMSFGFQTVSEHFEDDLRVLKAVDLFEISVVSSWPAYEKTAVHLRKKVIQNFKAETLDRRLKMLESGY